MILGNRRNRLSLMVELRSSRRSEVATKGKRVCEVLCLSYPATKFCILTPVDSGVPNQTLWLVVIQRLTTVVKQFTTETQRFSGETLWLVVRNSLFNGLTEVCTMVGNMTNIPPVPCMGTPTHYGI